MSIKVIDLFAGCGGLGEGFSALVQEERRAYEVCLSVDNNGPACDSLRLRKFFWEFEEAPDAYYEYLRGEITRDQLIELFPSEWSNACSKVVEAELGDNEFTDVAFSELVNKGVNNSRKWVLIGGPPCQAYSTIGRSQRNKENYKAEDDGRHFLYRQYLKVIAEHAPPIFLMENVPGILSSRVSGELIFPKILEDLENPVSALGLSESHRNSGLGYRIYSLTRPAQFDMFHSISNSPGDFVVKSEDFGVPQARHRVFLLGVRLDLRGSPPVLKPKNKTLTTEDVLSDLPRLRSGLSTDDSKSKWLETLRSIPSQRWMSQLRRDGRTELADRIELICGDLKCPKAGVGSDFVKGKVTPKYLSEWFCDPKLGGACNHQSRAHMASDLHRYLFSAVEMRRREEVFAAGKGVEVPHVRISDFPSELLPKHASARRKDKTGAIPFDDRFRVQRAQAPSSTLVSHLKNDGHAFIHFDPTQCRSLTVREAARLQTFPDNYFFEGVRGNGFNQVGNAVPPLLALQIARVIKTFLDGIKL